MTEFEGSAVLPAGPDALESVDPHRLLAAGEGLLVSWTAVDTSSTCSHWGSTLAGTSGLARSLTEVVQRAGAGRVAHTASLFRVEVPAGQTMRDLVPAIGGGFRGMTRSATGITGHARLVPVGGAAMGTGAAIALGPLVGLMALSVGTEMLARHQQEQQLKAIREIAEALLKRQKQQDAAVLRTSEDTIRAASAALLDKIRVPDAVGLGAAANNLHNLRNRAVGWLEAWEQGVRQHKPTEKALDLGNVKGLIGAPLDSSEDFESAVALLQQALVLDSRMLVLGAVEASTLNPDADLTTFRREVELDLRRNADVFERLQEVTHDLADYRVTVGYPHRPSTAANAERLAARLSRVAHAVSKPSTALPLLNEQNRLVIEAQRRSDGTWAVRQPLAGDV